MKQVFILVFCFATLGLQAQFKNIKIAEEIEGSPAGDPSIIINHRNPDFIAAAVGLDRVVTTLDGGKTWKESIVSSRYGLAGNSTVIFDARGHLYYFHRPNPENKGPEGDAWLDRIVCQKSTDECESWTIGTSIGNNPPKQQDKQAVAVNARKQILYTAWTQYDKYGSQETNCQSNIIFSMATNAGNYWDKPIQINQMPGDCSDTGNTASGASVAIGVDDRIYVTWSNHGVIFFDRSYDDGKTWLRADLPIAKQEGGWAMRIAGFGRVNSMPTLMIDNSSGRYHGMMYLVYADQRNGAEDTDVWMHRSTRHGDSWTSPIRLNSDPPGKQQFSPAVAVDQVNGNVFVVFYDRRAYDDLQTDVYLAYSRDGGATIKELKISETPFVASETKFFEFTSISAHDGIITPIWTRTDSGKVSVWTTIIKEDDLRKLK